MQMVNKENVVLYLDKEIVEKSKELGFNLSKTFENHLKYLMRQLSIGNSINNFELCENKMNMVGLPETLASPRSQTATKLSWKQKSCKQLPLPHETRSCEARWLDPKLKS
jgi:hypothetical protein